LLKNLIKKFISKKKEIIKLEMRYLFLKLSLKWSMGDHTKNSKKSRYTSSDYWSLKLILLVDGCQGDYITKSKEKEKNLV
jgi:hypothetical protein